MKNASGAPPKVGQSKSHKTERQKRRSTNTKEGVGRELASRENARRPADLKPHQTSQDEVLGLSRRCKSLRPVPWAPRPLTALTLPRKPRGNGAGQGGGQPARAPPHVPPASASLRLSVSVCPVSLFPGLLHTGWDTAACGHRSHPRRAEPLPCPRRLLGNSREGLLLTRVTSPQKGSLALAAVRTVLGKGVCFPRGQWWQSAEHSRKWAWSEEAAVPLAAFPFPREALAQGLHPQN